MFDQSFMRFLLLCLAGGLVYGASTAYGVWFLLRMGLIDTSSNESVSEFFSRTPLSNYKLFFQTHSERYGIFWTLSVLGIQVLGILLLLGGAALYAFEV
ncbi:MAG: hypothetical protein AB8G23_24050 [Myxococcota bacterium]